MTSCRPCANLGETVPSVPLWTAHPARYAERSASSWRGRMGRRIAIVGAGAVGGYTGAHMVQAGEDVTFIDPWPAHVEHMRQARLAGHAREDVPEFTVAVRALHRDRRAATGQGTAVRHRLRLHEVVRHRLGDHVDPAISGARRLRGLAAELHERGNHREHRRLGQDARLCRELDHGQSAGAWPHSSRRRQGRRGAYRVSRRRSAWPHHAARRGGLPPGWLFGQRQGDRTTCGASAGRSWSPMPWPTASPPAPD